MNRLAAAILTSACVCCLTGCAWIPGATTSGGTITQHGVGSGNVSIEGPAPALVKTTAVSLPGLLAGIAGFVLIVGLVAWLLRRRAQGKTPGPGLSANEVTP
jgi:ABC-type uncharacterized transport system permease subunit